MPDCANTRLKNIKLLYRARKDGWRSEDFFRCCKNQGPVLFLIFLNQNLFLLFELLGFHKARILFNSY